MIDPKQPTKLTPRVVLCVCVHIFFSLFLSFSFFIKEDNYGRFEVEEVRAKNERHIYICRPLTPSEHLNPHPQHQKVNTHTPPTTTSSLWAQQHDSLTKHTHTVILTCTYYYYFNINININIVVKVVCDVCERKYPLLNLPKRCPGCSNQLQRFLL